MTCTETGLPGAAAGEDDCAAWVESIPGLPCAARRLPPGYAQACGYAPAPPGVTWLDVSAFGQHAPQPWDDADIGVLTAEVCPLLGLCPACLGAGDLAPFPPCPADPTDLAGFLCRGPGELTAPCPGCGGSGRPALVIRPEHRGGVAGYRIMPLEHDYVPPLPGSRQPRRDITRWCLACGQHGERRRNCH